MLDNAFKDFKKYMNRKNDYKSILNKYGVIGVDKLRQATPKRTGKTADSWRYEVNGKKLEFYNDNYTQNGTPIVILLEYGRTTSSGYKKGTYFIKRTINDILNDIKKEVSEFDE